MTFVVRGPWIQLVGLIESSKHGSVLEEKVYQLQRKLVASEEKLARAQTQIVRVRLRRDGDGPGSER